MRFVIDDGAFRSWDDPTLSLGEALSILTDLLKNLRDNGNAVGVLGGWGLLQVTEHEDLATVLTSRRDMVDRDLGLLLLGLLGKCEIWDDDPSVVVSDDDLQVSANPYRSLGVAYAVSAASEGKGLGVVTMTQTGLVGLCQVSCSGFECELCFVVERSDCKHFYRSLYILENVGEKDFFDLAPYAFPDLDFADGLSFSKFDGGYSYRDLVVKHLSALNDDFLEVYVSEHGNSAGISARIGIDVSIEGETRSSERLMAMRDVEFRGHTFRCEWHSKLERNVNRIHFYPGDASTNGRTLIGIFVDHLPT
jgi:hypothetical protein